MAYNTSLYAQSLGELYDDVGPQYNPNGPGSYAWYMNQANQRSPAGYGTPATSTQNSPINALIKGAINKKVIGKLADALGGGEVASSGAANAVWNAGGTNAALTSSLANGTAGTEGLASAAPTSAGGLAGSGLGAGPWAGIAAQALLSGKAGLAELKGNKPDLLSRGALDLSTFGLNEAALPFLMHKSTKQVWNDNTNDLQSMAPDNQNWLNTISGYRNRPDDAGSNPNPFHGGQYASWDDYKKAGLDANDLTGVNGMLQTFGPKYADYNFDQKKALTQAAIDNNLFESKKGEVNVTDQDKLRSLATGILGVPPSA